MYQCVDISRVDQRAPGPTNAVDASFTRISFWFLRLQEGMGDGAREQEAPTDEGQPEARTNPAAGMPE